MSIRSIVIQLRTQFTDLMARKNAIEDKAATREGVDADELAKFRADAAAWKRAMLLFDESLCIGESLEDVDTEDGNLEDLIDAALYVPTIGDESDSSREDASDSAISSQEASKTESAKKEADCITLD